MHLPPSLLLPRTGLFTRRVHENRAVHCHLHPPNLTSVHHSAVDKHPAPRLTDWRRRGRNRERDTPTVFYTTHTHTRITAPTHPRTQPPHNCHCHLCTATCIASPGLSRCTPLAHFVFSRRIPLGSTPTLAPAPCSHPSTTRTTAVVSSHTEATHWRCTGVGRMLSTRRWADLETTNTAHSFTSPYTRSRNTPERHCHEQSACGNAVLQYHSFGTRETKHRTHRSFARHIVCLFSHCKTHIASLQPHDHGAVSPNHPLTYSDSQ